MKIIIALLISVVLLSSCSPAFGGGGFIVPVGLALGSAFSIYKYVKTKSKYSLGVGVLLAIAFVAALILMNGVK